MQITLMGLLDSRPDRSAVDIYIDELTAARDQGFRRMWTTQLMWEPDLLTVMAAAVGQVDGIEVGTAVLPVQVQHPTLLAQRALVVNQVAGGRLHLGLGVNHPGITEEMWGIPFAKPVRLMREYLDGLLPLLDGKPADAVGELVTTRATLQIPGAPAPQVYLAALGPQMLKLAGRRTTGTVTLLTGPKTLSEHIGPTLREAAEAAGRPAGAARVVAVLPVSVTDDVDPARALAAEEFAMHGQLPSYRAVLDREGFAGPEDAALIGDEATVLDRIAELRAGGVDELAAYPLGESAEMLDRTRALLRTCL
ncbi:TIGR03564 family F420-dependent LLM class oxidoreductase [Mycobacterium sp. URHB0021]|jgi:5,10-methylenetetrahydromethanopterin reductase